MQFNFSACGYGRADACVILFLQKASEAKRSYGSIIQIATKYDGTSESELLAIDKRNLVSFLQDFYTRCPVKPDEIDYVETYGCAVKVFNL